MKSIVLGSALGLIGLILWGFGLSTSRRSGKYSLYVESTRPAELAEGVPAFFGGLVAVTQPLQTPYSHQPCVYYSYSVEELRKTRDANGNEEDSWQTIASNTSSVPFWLQTPDGQIMVDPKNADIKDPQTTENLIRPDDVQGLGKLGTIVNLVSQMTAPDRRVRERYIPTGSQLNVGGLVSQQNGQKVFANDGEYPLVLTTQSKAEMLRSSHSNSVILYVLGGILLFGGGGVALFVHFK